MSALTIAALALGYVVVGVCTRRIIVTLTYILGVTPFEPWEEWSLVLFWPVAIVHFGCR